MIVSNDISNYRTAATTAAQTATPTSGIRLASADNEAGSGAQNGNMYQPEAQSQATVSSKVMTEADGSTVMQYTTMSPGGSIMRKNVMLHQADAFSPDPLNPSPMLRRRSDVYESMMQVF